MKQTTNDSRFGEMAFDTALDKDGSEKSGPTRWGPRYEDARRSALDLIQKFGLKESDFWIKKYWDRKNGEVVYQNLILSHGGCRIVGSKLPKDKQFDPMCVEEGNGVDGGCVLFYRSPKQGLFEVGEASLANNKFPFPYSIAKNRLYDKVVLRNADAAGIYGEDEAEDFKRYNCVLKSNQQPQSLPHQAEPAASFIAPDLLKRIEDLKWAVSFTGTNAQKMLASYGVGSYEQMSSADVDNAISILKPRVQNMRQQKLEQASTTSTTSPAPQQPSFVPDGISPVAQMIMAQADDNASPAPAPAVPPQQTESTASLGQTVYQSLDGAPEQFLELDGQTLDQIGKEMLKPLFGRKNAFGRRYVSAEMLDKIVEYISA